MGLEALVHDSSGWDNDLRDMPGVRRVGYVADLPALIAEADLIVLPYGVERYRTECSGIACLGIACGVPAVGPAGTTIEDRLREYNTGLVYSDLSTEGIIKAIAEMRIGYEDQATRAFAASKLWAKTNGVARHAAAMMGGA